MRLVQASSFFPSQVVATQAKTAANKTHTVKTNPPSNNMQKQHASKNMYQKHAINVIKFKLIYFYLTYLNIIIYHIFKKYVAQNNDYFSNLKITLYIFSCFILYNWSGCLFQKICTALYIKLESPLKTFPKTLQLCT